jgi:hypothetical protein
VIVPAVGRVRHHPGRRRCQYLGHVCGPAGAAQARDDGADLDDIPTPELLAQIEAEEDIERAVSVVL